MLLKTVWQGIVGTTYSGDTANDNTSLQINDPGVMDKDSDDLGIVWNPNTETWYSLLYCRPENQA